MQSISAVIHYCTEEMDEHKRSVQVDEMVETLTTRYEEMAGLLSVLKVAGELTRKLQERGLELYSAQQLLNHTATQLSGVEGLPDTINVLRNDLVSRLSRFPTGKSL